MTNTINQKEKEKFIQKEVESIQSRFEETVAIMVDALKSDRDLAIARVKTMTDSQISARIKNESSEKGL